MPRAEKELRQHKYNQQYLGALPRKRLQALAKQEGIRGNIKSEDIIGQIMQGLQRSPPTSVTEDDVPLAEEPSARIQVKRTRGDPIGTEGIHQRDSLRHEGDTEEVLSLSHIRDARRLLTQINDELISSGRDLDDIHEILTYANGEVTKVQGMVKDMIEVRIEIEEGIVKRLHIDRHLWDGTGLMPARHRVKWRAFVSESKEKRRRDEEVVQDSL